MTEAERIARLTPPSGHPVRMVLDTDTYNEIDDQYAVVYALLAGEAIETEAVYAAPFHNGRSEGPGDGMEKSYDEILRLLDRLDRPSEGFVFKGSTDWMPDAETPVDSPAARDLIAKAMSDDARPLYVATIGAPTNVASAIVMEPAIRDRIVVVWLGGHPHDWPNAREFNCQQNPCASRVLFDSGVPLVQIPCKNVAEHLRTTLPEIERYVAGKGRIGEFLARIYVEYFPHLRTTPAASKVIWDISAIAWLIHPEWVPTNLVHSPILTDQLTWSRDESRHLIRAAVHCDRDAIFRDLFTRIGNAE